MSKKFYSSYSLLISMLSLKKQVIKVGLVVLATFFIFILPMNVNAQSNNNDSSITDQSSEKKTLVIVSHPYPERSRIIMSLQQTAENTKGTIVRNLETLYGNNTTGFDVQLERKLYEDVDRIIFVFPIHWFNLTPMLKAYFNEVWTAWAPNALKGKEMFVVTSAGASEQLYTREGRLHHTIEEILTPFETSANYAGLKYLKPLAFLGVSEADEDKISLYQKAFFERLIEK